MEQPRQSDLPTADTQARQHVEFTRRVSVWLKAAGVDDPDARSTLSVGIADSLHAMDVARREVAALLATDPSTSEGAGAALHHAVQFAVYAFDELKDHLDEMHVLWEPHLEESLTQRVPDESAET